MVVSLFYFLLKEKYIKHLILKNEGNFYMEIDLYCCYSLNLRNFLYNNGLRYKLCALNPNSEKRFWVYIKDEKLNTLLNEWSTTNK